MPFHPRILDDLAAKGALIAIDTETASLAEIRAEVNYGRTEQETSPSVMPLALLQMMSWV